MNTIELSDRLLIASTYGYKDQVKNLIKLGANIHVKNKIGLNPLHCASQRRHFLVVEELLKVPNIPLNEKDDFGGLTALHHAASQDAYLVIELLISAGANVNLLDNFGCTPLHAAAQSGSVRVVKDLLDAGADINAKDKYGNTPLQVAVEDEIQDRVFQYLLERGASRDGFL